MSMCDDEALMVLSDVIENFQGRHHNLLGRFEARADEMEPAVRSHQAFNIVQKRLIGAYFLNEYAYEAAALFNPQYCGPP